MDCDRIRRTLIASGATYDVGYGSAQGLTLGPDGFLYYPSYSYVYRVNPSTGAMTTFTTFPYNAGALTADTSALYVAVVAVGGTKIVRVPVLADGVAGTHEDVIAADVDHGRATLTLGEGGGVLYGDAVARTRLRRYDLATATWRDVAGSGSQGFADGVGSDAWFGAVVGLSAQSVAGTDVVWVADQDNHRLRRGSFTTAQALAQPYGASAFPPLGPTAVVSTLAGSGSATNSDNTDGLAAGLKNPVGVAAVGRTAFVGTSGAARRVSLENGSVTTLSGSLSDATTCKDSTDPAVTRFGSLAKAVTDSVYLYGLDCNNMIRRVELDTGAASTVRGPDGGQSRDGLAIGPDGFLYTSSGGVLYRIDPPTGTRSVAYTWASGGLGALTADSRYVYGALIFTDYTTKIVRFDPSTSSVVDVTGRDAGHGRSALVSAGDYLYGDAHWGKAVRRYSKATGAWVDIAGGSTAGFADGIGTNARFDGVTSIAVEPSSSDTALLVTDMNNHRLRRIAQSGATTGLPVGQTFGCRSLPAELACDYQHAANPTNEMGDPVNTATGGLAESFVDVTVAGEGVPFTFVRSYNSLDPSSGRMGVGWTDSLNASLALSGDTATLRGETGQQVVYRRAVDGTFSGDPGARSTLVATPSGYRVTTTRGRALDFDTEGRLTAARDRHGVGLSLTYTGGQLATVTDAAGRTFAFTHIGQVLTEVRLPDGRAVGYGYTDGRLTSVTDLAGHTTTYGYDGEGRLAWARDALGNYTMRTTYDASGRVVEQLDAAGNRTAFSWDAATQTSRMTDPRGGIWTDVYRGNALVRQSDPLGNTIDYVYDGELNVVAVTDARRHTTTMVYDDAGNLVRRTRPEPLSSVETFAWNPSNDLVSTTDARGYTTRYSYDPAGRLTTATAADGSQTTFTYGTGQRVASITDARGKTTQFTYDAAGNRTGVQTPSGAIQTFGYDSAGRLTSVVDPRGNVAGSTASAYTTSFTYDNADRLVKVTDPRGYETSHTFDPAGRLTSITNATGHVTTYTHDASGRVVTATEPGPATTTLEYDAAGNLTATVSPGGSRTTFGYDLAGRRTSVTMPRGNEPLADAAAHTWTHTYDAVGNLTGVSNATTGTTLYSYDVANRQASVTNALGHTTTVQYDAAGNTIAVTDALGHTTAWSYDIAGRVVAATDALGAVTRFRYDATGRRVSRITPNGSTTTWAYDDDGRIVAVTDPRGNVTGADPAAYRSTVTYDAAGHVTAHTDPLGHSTVLTYDSVGNVTTRSDANNHTTAYSYDPLNRLASVTGPDHATTSYGYDARGNLASRTDPYARTTAYGYDLDDRLTAVTSPIGQWTTNYDADSNPVSVVTPSGNASVDPSTGTITASYDPAGRQTLLDYGDSTPDVTATYDAVGHRTGMTDGAGTQTAGYDPVGRLTSLSRGTTGWAYTYDPAGRLTGRTAPDGTATTLGYDVDGFLTAVTSSQGSIAYAYDAAGNVTTTTLPATNGYLEARVYDAAGRLSDLENRRGNDVLSRYSVTRDPVGNPTRMTTTQSGTTTVASYTYDPADRLASTCDAADCTTSSTTTTFTYDASGNRVSRTVTTAAATITTDYTYNSAGQLSTTISDGATSTYGYDANGQQVAAGSSTYGYDLAGRLITATTPSGTTNYAYDGDGNRVSRATGATVDRHYTWDPNNPLPQLAHETDASGNLIRRYLYAVDPIAVTTPDGTWYYHRDPMANITELTTATGVAAHRYAYDPFGNGTVDTTLDAADIDNPLRFNGQYRDAETTLYHLRARHYDPSIGRFTAPDPITPPLTDPYVSSYVYANNRPTVMADPSGLTPDWLTTGHLIAKDATLGLLYAAEGVALTAVDVLAGLTHAIDHPIKTFTALNQAYRGAYHAGGGGWWGILEAANLVNPLYHFLNNGASALCYAKAGDLRKSVHNGVNATLDVATVIGSARAIRMITGSHVAPRVPVGALDDASRAAFRAADNIDDFTVPLKHQPWASGNYAKFAQGVDQQGLIAQSLRSDAARFLPNNRPGSFRVVHDFGQPIGTGGETALRVVVGNDGRIWTAFPVKP